MKAYKGFNKDMTCRGFQFEEGKTYEEPEAKLCKCGFHACEYPLAVFGHYAPSSSVFHEVELDGVCKERGDDTKVCGKKITIGARLDISGMVKAAVDFVFAKADWSKKENHATGYQGVASATGYQGVASATGYRGVASATGYRGAASATGYQGVASALGFDGKAKGALGCWLVLAEWEESEQFYVRKDVKCAKVDGEAIKADVWYKLQNGEFVEAGE